ncbi:lysophosphatidic acid phosphatase type 6 [Nematocida sp. AWRm77]|nr:lysophosphatidic acid phosphatase type 6 [Nematocida sp. AWRm77]
MNLILEYIHLVHRHGERTPLMFGPHDKTKWNMCERVSKIGYVIPQSSPGIFDRMKRMANYLATGHAEAMSFSISLNSARQFNCAPGQLTDVGRRNLFGLGMWFKTRYHDNKKFISSSFQEEEFFLRSTNFQRTLESLQSLMQGIFRSHTGEININVNDLTADTLGCNRYCPNLKTLRNQSHEQLKAAFAKKGKAISEYFAKTFSPSFTSLSPYSIYDLVASSRAHGFSRFRSVPKSIMDDLEQYSISLWFNHLNTKEALGMNTGCLMKEISEQMLQKTQSPLLKRKVSIFSAHDVTVYPMLMALGVHTKKWPKFGANIIFELLRDANTQQRYVNVLYNGSSIRVPKCRGSGSAGQSLCTLEEFVQICNDTYLENFAEVCGRS